MGAQWMESPQFLGLVRKAWLEPVRFVDAQAARVPGVAPEEVWEALTTLRRTQAFISPASIASPRVIANWHNVTQSLAHTITEIARRTCAGSPLGVIAADRAGTGFITQQYVEEVQANLLFDGYESTYEDLRAVLLAERPPVDDAEWIAVNYHGIVLDMPQLAESAYDKELLYDLYERLTKGVKGNRHSGVFQDDTLLIPHSPLEEHYVAAATPGDEATLQMPIDVANGRLGNPRRHPIMESMLVNCQFWRAPLFETCNNLMGCIASRLYLVREGFPVMRYVPKIRILEKWRQGAYGGAARAPYEEAMQAAETEGDWTLYYDTVMALQLREIQAMERSLTNRAAADEAALAGVARVPYLSHRQRDILRAAVLSPSTEFAIGLHQKNYNIAYSTARADLEKLADAGYLTRFMHGSAYHYRAAANLRALLAGE